MRVKMASVVIYRLGCRTAVWFLLLVYTVLACSIRTPIATIVDGQRFFISSNRFHFKCLTFSLSYLILIAFLLASFIFILACRILWVARECATVWNGNKTNDRVVLFYYHFHQVHRSNCERHCFSLFWSFVLLRNAIILGK